MSLTVVGSLAFDALETPHGKRDRILGGAATHFSLAARFFTDVRVVGVVGDDFGPAEFDVFHSRGINMDDVEQVQGQKSFFWAGRYDDDMESAQTLDTQLNVFADFDPTLSEGARAADVVFLANILPDLQRRVRDQCVGAAIAGLDSMNYWIASARDALIEAIRAVEIVILNDAELRMLTGEPNLARAARSVCALGPRAVVVKQGSYGACLFDDGEFFFIPGYPLDTVIDPTGAGDAFAGGFFGYLDSQGGEAGHDVLRRAAVYGSVLASYAIEAFGGERLQSLTMDEIESRFAEFRDMTRFESRATASSGARSA